MRRSILCPLLGLLMLIVGSCGSSARLSDTQGSHDTPYQWVRKATPQERGAQQSAPAGTTDLVTSGAQADEDPGLDQWDEASEVFAQASDEQVPEAHFHGPESTLNPPHVVELTPGSSADEDVPIRSGRDGREGSSSRSSIPSILAFGLMVASIILAFTVPSAGAIAFLLLVMAFPMALIGLVTAGKAHQRGKGFAVVTLVISALLILLALLASDD